MTMQTTTDKIEAGAAPGFNFTTTVGGLRQDFPDGRSVAVHLGRDENDTERWAIILTNNGVETRFGLSDEAMDAMIGMFMQLVIASTKAGGASS